MAVPRQRQSNSRKNMRRAHHAKKPTYTSSCSNCAAPCLSHRICKSCGHYKNRPVLKQEAAS